MARAKLARRSSITKELLDVGIDRVEWGIVASASLWPVVTSAPCVKSEGLIGATMRVKPGLTLALFRAGRYCLTLASASRAAVASAFASYAALWLRAAW